MQRAQAPRPVPVQVALTIAGLTLLVGIYLVAMRMSIDVSRLSAKGDANHRDAVYLAIHGGMLLLATIGGFALGRWLAGLGIAYALLFVAVLSVLMVGAQLGSYEAACHGHNDVIRHWTC